MQYGKHWLSSLLLYLRKMELENSETNILATNAEAKNIHAINREAVHKICSGQVVLSLAIAVKELLENAIDAGATCIEIRLKEYGSELIEVIDNGSGVEESNFTALTLKHYTSKLKEFSDLESVSTLGFRGEALSSLCALSNLTILTRHNTVEYATKIEYDKNGHIKSKTPCPRQIGTTVMLSNLFSTLPVRHIEFIKNLKREFTKMCQLLYAYCITAEGIRIICTNQTKKARTTVISTQGSKDIKDNIICIFGTKQLETLIEIKFHEPDEKILEDFAVVKSDEPLPFKFNGFISKCTHGSGRSANDRQFYYINSRPCEPIKLIKLVNEVYRLFNGNQYPFVYLNITTEQSQIDVNVTPDKRQIFMEKEKLLLATLKTSLLEMFKEFPSTLKLQNFNLSSKVVSKSEKTKCTSLLQQWSKSDNSLDIKRGVKRITSPTSKPLGVMGYIYEKRLKIQEDAKIELSENSASEDEGKQIETFIKDSYNSSDSEPDFTSIKTKSQDDSSQYEKEIENSSSQTSDKTSSENSSQIEDCFNENADSPYTLTIDTLETIATNVQQGLSKFSKQIHHIIENEDLYPKFIISSASDKLIDDSESKENSQNEDYESELNENLTPVEDDGENDDAHTILSDPDNYLKAIPVIENIHTIDTEINVSEDDIKNIIAKIEATQISKETDTVIKFRSELTSKTAEEELQKQISKDMFEKMSILGQFNKGFIVTQFESDLFIIDQHATDEKYNFEMLQQTTVLQNQQLVNPKRLDLTAANEILLMENIDVFKKNGFAFKVDENAEPRNKVLLTAIPVSRSWAFGKEDIDELLFMLQEDACLANFRPSRVRAMFASRACRKSVMIGSVLSHNDMRRLVDHMGQIEQPWNCPHGRPTMRHLINLDLIEDDK